MDAGTRKVWFITGAGRGMGADFARAVLAAGHALVATGRDTKRLSKVLGPSKELLTVKLDVTNRADAEAAVRAAAEGLLVRSLSSCCQEPLAPGEAQSLLNPVIRWYDELAKIARSS